MIAKTKEEIEILREGGRRLARILKEAAALVRPGISAGELEALARKLIAEGGDKPAFLNYKPEGAKSAYKYALCVSINDEIVHGLPLEDKIIKDGDIVSIDIGLNHRGFFTDHATTVIAGVAREEDAKLLLNTKIALEAGIKQARAGGWTGDIGAAVFEIAKKNNYGVIRELAGHGVGKKVHEDPYVPNYGQKGQGTKLEEGLVIAIEPMFALGTEKVTWGRDGWTIRTRDGSHAAHFEHTVLVTKDGAEILTKI